MVDGGQHGETAHAQGDAQRDERLALLGFRILRFWNSDVDRNLEGVLDRIDNALRESPHPAGLTPATLPLKGEG
jgi:very-short-patch-repair endonuclease